MKNTRRTVCQDYGRPPRFSERLSRLAWRAAETLGLLTLAVLPGVVMLAAAWLSTRCVSARGGEA